MYSRKNTQVLENTSIEFSTFQKKSRQLINEYDKTSFTLHRIQNAIAITLSIVHIMKTPPKQSLISEIFSRISMEQVPRQFLNYQHSETLESLLGVIVNKMTSVQSAVDLLNSFPIAEFVLNVYARNLISKFINEGAENSVTGNSQILQGEIERIQLMGNEEEIISQYNLELRGTLLHLLALYTGIDLKVIYGKEIDGCADLVQNYGSSLFPHKVEITYVSEDKLLVNISEVSLPNGSKSRPSGSLASSRAQAPNRIPYNYPNMNKVTSEDVMSIRSQLSSRSVTKDSLSFAICENCGKKNRFCLCTAENKKKTGVTPKGLNSSASGITSNFNSMLDCLTRDTFISINSDRKCFCNRALCKICKKK